MNLRNRIEMGQIEGEANFIASNSGSQNFFNQIDAGDDSVLNFGV